MANAKKTTTKTKNTPVASYCREHHVERRTAIIAGSMENAPPTCHPVSTFSNHLSICSPQTVLVEPMAEALEA